MKRFNVISSLLIAASFHFYLGSAQINSWRQTNGPFLDQVQSLATNQAGEIFAASGYYLYRSTDAGQTWAKLSMDYVKVASIAIDSHGHIFLGTLGLMGGRIYRSVDGAQTWQLLNPGPRLANVSALAVGDAGSLFAGGGNGIFRSTDDGNNWSEVNIGLPQTQVFCLLAASKDTIFAGTAAGVFRSVNQGDDWHSVVSGDMQTFTYSLAKNSNGYLYAGTIRGRVFRSIDDGASWTLFNSGLPDAKINSLNATPSGSVFAGTDSGMYRTNHDQGWLPITSISTSTRVNVVLSLPGDQLLAGTSAGAISSMDGGIAWRINNRGLVDSRVWSLAIDPTDRVYAGAEGGGMYFTDDHGNNWVQCGLNGTRPYSIVFDSEDQLFVGIDGGVLRSSDRGQTWFWSNNGFDHHLTVTSLACHQSGAIFCASSGAYAGVYRSTDYGGQWTKVTDGLTTQNTLALAIDQAGAVYAGTFGGGVFRSNDLGDHWAQSGAGQTDTVVRALAIDLHGHIYAGTYDGVFRSTDHGMNWSFAGLSKSVVWAIAISSLGDVIAGTTNGIYTSTNAGYSWSYRATGLTDSDVRSAAIDSRGYVFAGTLSSGVFRSGEPLTSVDGKRFEAPVRISLYQNYPNPFNPSTTIQYDLPKSAIVSLKIFNTLGQVVATLANEKREAGYYAVQWNPTVPSGIYFYRLQSGEYVETKKMIVPR